MKHLTKQAGVWHIRVARPPKCWGCRGEFWQSLHTGNQKEAERLRDRYLIPVLTAASGIEMMRTLLGLLAAADQELKDRLQELGHHLGNSKVPTVGDMFEAYLSFRRKSKAPESTIETYQACGEAFRKLGLDGIEADKLTTAEITQFRDRLLTLPAGWQKMPVISSAPAGAKTASPTTINNYLRRFRFVWQWNVQEGKIPKRACPADGIGAAGKKNRKSARPVTEYDADGLLELPFPATAQNVDKHAWHFLPRIARYTGMRLAEVCQLRREDIREESGILCISVNDHDGKTTKTRDSVRLVPVSAKLEEIIKPLLKRKGELFPNTGTYGHKIGHDFSKAFNRRAKQVGEHLNFHGFRAYAITAMANAGVPEIDRMRIVGHSSKSVHAGYTGDDLARFKAAVDKIP
ncbi:MAG: hypothetical protein RL095_2147 [Verrucomicrobiota bacterium]|jgi:integrase